MPGRAVRSVPAVIKTFILRLVSERLSGGETVGRAEEVDTGRATVVHDADHLLRFLAGHDDGDEPDMAPHPATATESDAGTAPDLT